LECNSEEVLGLIESEAKRKVLHYHQHTEQMVVGMQVGSNFILA
jgi:hypothetical protein